jgi:hypothetical protein
MSLGSPFTPDSFLNKFITNRTGDGLSRSTSPQAILGGGAPTPRYAVSVKDKPGSGGDHEITHTGPGAGVFTGVGKPTDLQGFVSATGNKVLIDNTFGSDTITLQHHSGATIMIDADGAIHMISTGKKGVGMVAPNGDGTVHAKNHLILSGDGKVTIQSSGDLDINVGGTLSFNVRGDILSSVRGSSEEIVGGTKTIEVVKDFVSISAGDQSHTSAGNFKIQASSEASLDAAKDINIRTDAQMKTQVQADHIIIVKGDSSQDVKGKLTITTEGDTKHQTKGTFDILAKGDATFNTKATLGLLAEGATTIQTKSSLDMLSDANMQVISNGTTTLSSSGRIDVASGSSINLKGSATNVQAPGGPSTISVSAGSADDAGDVKDAMKAMYAPAKVIMDSVTSDRVAPDFPANAKFMTANEMSLYQNEGGKPNPKAEAYAAGNKGGGMNAQPQEAGVEAQPASQSPVDTPQGISPNGTSQQNPLPVPTSVANANEKISRHVTVGMIVDRHLIPADQLPSVMKEAMNTAWNILDPVIEKFGSQVRITSWFRKPPKGNHCTGGAVDFAGAPRGNHSKTGEIASWIRDNLPYKQLFLEKNKEGTIHIHCWASPPGSGASGLVQTCADPECRSKVNGIQLSYAVAALKGSGVQT